MRLPLPVLALFLLVLGFVLPGHLEANLAHPGASWEAPPGLPTGHLDTDQPGRTLALLFLEVRDLAETTQQAEPPSSPDFSRYSPPALVLLLELPKSALEELAAWADLRAFVLERRVYQFSGTDPPADATTPNPAGASDSGGLSRVRRSAVELETRVRAFRVLDAGFALGSEAGEPRIELDRRGRVAAVRVGLVSFLDGPNRYRWNRNNPFRYRDLNGLFGEPISTAIEVEVLTNVVLGTLLAGATYEAVRNTDFVSPIPDVRMPDLPNFPTDPNEFPPLPPNMPPPPIPALPPSLPAPLPPPPVLLPQPVPQACDTSDTLLTIHTANDSIAREEIRRNRRNWEIDIIEPFRDAALWAAALGGKARDYRKYSSPRGDSEIHWVENIRSGQIYGAKFKYP